MPRKPFLPSNLLRRPFTLDDARREGLHRGHLRGAAWRRVGPGTYSWVGLSPDPMHTLQAAVSRLPAGAAFSGLTAAWLHGIDVEPCDPIEATVPEGAGVSGRAGMRLRRSRLARDEVSRVRGLPATSIVRTLAELCSRLSLVEAVVIADAALHARRVRFEQLTLWAASRRGHRGIKSMRRVLGFVDAAAESPMESRLRMLLVLARLPRPRAQVSIRDRWGRVIGRPDLYYERARLGIEYDGAVHRNSLAEDNQRQNRLLSAGVRLLRFTAADVLGNPNSVVAQVRAMLEDNAVNPPTAGKSTLPGLRKRPIAGSRPNP